MPEDDYGELIGAIERLREQMDVASDTTTEGTEEEIKEAKEAKDRARQRAKLHRERIKATRRLSRVVTKLTMYAVRPLIGAFKEGLAQFHEFEKIGASFNKALDKNFSGSQKLAVAMGGTENIISAQEAFGFALQTANTGLDINSKSMQKLIKSTIKSGEDFKGLSVGLRGSTAGLSSNTVNMESLVDSLNKTAGVFNTTRAQLVQAMNALSDSMLNMQGALGIGGLQEGMMSLRGMLKDDRLFATFNKNMEAMLGPGGLQKSITLGIGSVRGQMLGGQGDMTANMLEAIFTGAQRAKGMLGGAQGTMIGPEIMQALEQAGVINASNIRLQEAILREAVTTLDIAGAANMSSHELANAISSKVKENRAAEQEFGSTLASLKKEILMPFINIAGEVAIAIKEFVTENKDQIVSIVKSLAFAAKNIIIGIMKAVASIEDWLPKFKAIVATMVALKGAQAAGGILDMVSLIPGVGTLAKVGSMAFKALQVAKVAAVAGAGVYAGVKTHQLLSSSEKSGNKTAKMMDDLNKKFDGFMEDREKKEGKTAEGMKKLTDEKRADKAKSDMDRLMLGIQGIARFRISQESLIIHEQKKTNMALGSIMKSSADTAVSSEEIKNKPVAVLPPEPSRGVTRNRDTYLGGTRGGGR